MEELEVGQTIYVTFYGFGFKEPNLHEYEVKRVNKTSFYASAKEERTDIWCRFNRRTMKSKDGLTFMGRKAYVNPDDYYAKVEKEAERRVLVDKWHNEIDRMSLDELKDLDDHGEKILKRRKG